MSRTEKMNTLDLLILETLLAENTVTNQLQTAGTTIYQLTQKLRRQKPDANYTTTWRHVKNMAKQNLIQIIGQGKREATLLAITNKGIATYLLKANPNLDKLLKLSSQQTRDIWGQLKGKEALLTREFFSEILATSIEALKPRVNLEFFSEEWFREALNQAYQEAWDKAIAKYESEFVKAGIWQQRTQTKSIFDALLEDAYFKHPKRIPKNVKELDVDNLGELLEG